MKFFLFIAVSFTMALTATSGLGNQSWLSGTNSITTPLGSLSDIDLIDNATLIVTNGGSLLAGQLVVGPTNPATLKLYPNAIITVAQLLATNNTAGDGAVTNSMLGFLGGTLITSNASAAIAAKWILSSNFTSGINGTWNMLGGTNLTTPVSSFTNSSQLAVGSGGTGVVLVSRAIWDLSGPVAGTSNTVLNIGSGSGSKGTVIVESGGVIQNVGFSGASQGFRVGNNGSSGNYFIITNGGKLFGLSYDLMIGNGSTSTNNALIVAGTNSILDGFSEASMRKSAIKVGSSNSRTNTVLVDGGVITNIHSIQVGSGTGSGNVVIITNGGRIYSSQATCPIGAVDYASGNSMFVCSNSLFDLGGVILGVGYGNNAVFNKLFVDGGVVTNVGSLRNGSSGYTNGSCNDISVSNGGRIYVSGSTVLGYNGSSNSLNIAGPDCLLSQSGSAYIGQSLGGNYASNSIANSMVVSNGAQVVCGTLAIGYLQYPGAICADNYAIIGGGGDLARVVGKVTIGYSSGVSNNWLVLNSGGILTNGLVTVGSAGSSGSRLAGCGLIYGPTIVNSNALLEPGGPDCSFLTISNKLTLAGTVVFKLNVDSGACTSIRGLSNVVYGGTLVVTNLTDGGFVTGQSFKLFDALFYSNQFSSYDLPALPSDQVWDTSNLAVNGTLTVLHAYAPTVTSQALASQNVLLGSGVSFSAQATGTAPFTWQWLRNGSLIVGATNSALSFEHVGLSDSGCYDVIVANSAGTTTRRIVQLLVSFLPVSMTTEYFYDALGRLVVTTRLNTNAVAYGFDDASNLTYGMQVYEGFDQNGNDIPDAWEIKFLGSTDVAGSNTGSNANWQAYFLAYAFGRDPNLSPDPDIPQVDIRALNGHRYLYYTYRRNKFATKLNFVPEVSTDLKSWQSGVSYVNSVGIPEDNGDGTEMVTLRCQAEINSNSNYFLRLSVQSN